MFRYFILNIDVVHSLADYNSLLLLLLFKSNAFNYIEKLSI